MNMSHRNDKKKIRKPIYCLTILSTLGSVKKDLCVDVEYNSDTLLTFLVINFSNIHASVCIREKILSTLEVVR